MKKRILLLFLLMIVLSVFAFFSWKDMSFSKEVLKIEILSSERASIGEEINYIVKIKNNGNIRLESPELIFEYPDNAIISDNEGKIKIMSSDQLGGDIYPGEERTFKFGAVLLGQEKEIKIAKTSVSFQPKDLKTRSEVSTTFTTILENAPINISIESPAKVGNGKTLSLKVNYFSNASYDLNDLTCYIQYPSNFDILFSQPKGLDNSQFDIPVLAESSSGTINVSGILNGESSEQKVFKAKIGIWQDGNFIVLKEATKSIEISSPSLYVTQRVNNDSNYTTFAGDVLHYEIFFQNIGDQALRDLALISKIESAYVDIESIDASEAIVDGNTIIWNASNFPSLSFLDIGETGKIEFSVNVSSDLSGDANIQNLNVKNSVTIGETRQDFITKIGSVISLEQKFYTDNRYFENSGPYPLETGERTYLTIEWAPKNYYNDIENARIVTALPESITFEGAYGAGKEITYDENTSEVVCNIGSLPAGSGVKNKDIVCAFQVSIKPEIADEVIILLGAAQLSGVDQWTNITLTAKTNLLYAQMSF
ncbi:MAG: hypothetical protein PHU17_01685 [Candidatus Pacebacteria bacterium]|nr:hypothetical protein [Candidatus Paceibacterota bacterium]